MKFTIKERERIDASAATGLSKSWTEYQVWQGRKIVHRAELHRHAKEWVIQQLEEAEKYNQAMQPAMAYNLLDTLTEGIDPTSAGHWVEVCNKFINNHKLLEANK